VGTVGDALDAIRRCIFDAAFLDIDLNGASGLQIAAALREKIIPFALISGNAHPVSKHFEHFRLIDKPLSRASSKPWLGTSEAIEFLAAQFTPQTVRISDVKVENLSKQLLCTYRQLNVTVAFNLVGGTLIPSAGLSSRTN
jgi:hypothetical protein